MNRSASGCAGETHNGGSFFENSSNLVRWTREALIPWHKQASSLVSEEKHGRAIGEDDLGGMMRTSSKSSKGSSNNRSSSRDVRRVRDVGGTLSGLDKSASWGSNLDSHAAMWEEGTSFLMGKQQPANQKQDLRGVTFQKITEAMRSLLRMGEVMDAADTEEDRMALRRLLEADMDKKRIWRVLERLVVEKERTRLRLERLSQSAGPGFSPLRRGVDYGGSSSVGPVTRTDTFTNMPSAASSPLSTNLVHLGDAVVDESVGPLFNISF